MAKHRIPHLKPVLAINTKRWHLTEKNADNLIFPKAPVTTTILEFQPEIKQATFHLWINYELNLSCSATQKARLCRFIAK